MPDRLASLQQKARILGIQIEDILDDADAIERRIGSYKTASASVKMGPGFIKTATAIEPPQAVSIDTK